MHEGSAKIGDFVTAELVECAPAPEPTVLPDAPETSPAQRIAQATIEQTGADPPPAGGLQDLLLPSLLLLLSFISASSSTVTHG